MLLTDSSRVGIASACDFNVQTRDSLLGEIHMTVGCCAIVITFTPLSDLTLFKIAGEKAYYVILDSRNMTLILFVFIDAKIFFKKINQIRF